MLSRSPIPWIRPPFSKSLLSITDGHTLSKVLGTQKSSRDRLCPHGAPSLVGEVGIESRTQHSRGQISSEFYGSPEEKVTSLALEGVSIKEGFL